jgi:hypothetical protein
MHSSLLLSSVCLVSASLWAQSGNVRIDGETPLPVGTAVSTPRLVSGPLGPGAVPASLRATFGNSNNNIPFSWTPCSYQQIFDGSELPATPYPVVGLGLRQDDQFNSYLGYTIDMEMKLGYSTLTPATLTSTFASNFNTTPPTVVIARKVVAQPQMPPTNPTDPTVFFHQIKFDAPWIWTQVSGRNIVIEVRNHANGNNNAIFTYPLDAGSGTGITTTRLYGLTGPGDTTGTLGVNYGMVMDFLDKVKLTGSYISYGTGCRGTGGFAGQVVPAAYAAAMGNTNNYYPHGRMNLRYQQSFLSSELTRAGVFNGWALRQTSTTTGRPGGTQTVQIKLGYTTFDHHSLSLALDSNFNSGTPTTVLSGTINIPTLTGTNTNPADFAMVVPFTTPWAWAPVSGRNLLIEVVNTSTADVLQYLDAASAATVTTTRLWSNTATGTYAQGVTVDFGLIMGFRMAGAGSAIPVLGAVGRPVINKSFDITLSQAKPSSAALLFFGFSNTAWGALPLPFDCTVIGAPGCRILAAGDILFSIATDATGNGKLTFPVPNSVNLAGSKFYNQYLVADAGANTLGYAFTNGGEALIGEQ